MPFDNAPQIDPQVALYLDRRERAAKLWRSVPEERFNIKDWGSCGTTACALGWLAILEIDGWHYNGDIPVLHNSPSWDAARYFGLDITESFLLFSRIKEFNNIYRKRASKVTPSDVADALFAMPVTIPDWHEPPRHAPAHPRPERGPAAPLCADHAAEQTN